MMLFSEKIVADAPTSWNGLSISFFNKFHEETIFFLRIIATPFVLPERHKTNVR